MPIQATPPNFVLISRLLIFNPVPGCPFPSSRISTASANDLADKIRDERSIDLLLFSRPPPPLSYIDVLAAIFQPHLSQKPPQCLVQTCLQALHQLQQARIRVATGTSAEVTLAGAQVVTGESATSSLRI